MKRMRKLIPLIVIGSLFATCGSSFAEDKKDKDKDKKDFAPSHMQVGTIDVCKDDKSLGLNAFCLDSSGNILAAVGKSVAVYGAKKDSAQKIAQGIRVFDPNGEMTAFWPLDFTPQAIGYGPDNHIYVGGDGRIARLNRNGDVVSKVDAPNMQNRDELVAKLRKEHEKRIEQTKKTYQNIIQRTEKQIEEQKARLEALKESPEAFAKEMAKTAQTEINSAKARIRSYENMLKQYKKLVENANDDRTKKAYENAIASTERNISNMQKRVETLEKSAENVVDKENYEKQLKRELRVTQNKIKSFERSLKTYRKYLENNANAEMSEIQIENMLKQKSKVSSVSVTEDYVYVVCQTIEGYGFDIWRTDKELKNPKKLVKGLRGCCGQMDVQACKTGLFVAENTRHRVAHYDFEGKQVGAFGKRDAKGEEGFGSCCNPMNVCFAKGNTVLTAESGTGRIMQFNEKGEKIGVIGNGKITGGCKNVAVHATHDLSTVYMLDLTGKKICILKPKEPAEEDNDGEK